MSDLDDASVGTLYDAFGFRFRLTGSLAVRLSPMFEGMTAVDPPPGIDHHVADGTVATHRVDLDRASDGHLTLTIDGERSFETADIGALLHHAVWEATRRGVAQRPDAVMLHAAVAIVEHTIVVLSGPSGAGKSTLVAGLVADGAVYVTDEAVEVDTGGNVVGGLSRPIHLSRSSLTMLSHAPGRRDVVMPGGGSYSMPDHHRARPTPVQQQPVVIVRLGELGSTLHSPRLTTAHLVAALAGESLSTAATTQAGLESVKNLAIRAQCVTLHGGSATDRVNFVKNLVSAY